MNRIWDLTNQSDSRTRDLARNQQVTGQVIGHHVSGSNDSGVSGLNISINNFPLVDPISYSSTADLMAYRLQHLHFEQSESDDVRNTNWYIEDENKENICPILRRNRTNRTGTFSLRDMLPPDLPPVNIENILRIFSQPRRPENHNEQEREASMSPFLAEHTLPRSSDVTSDSVLSDSSLHSHAFPSLLDSHPIHATPRHSPVRRRARTSTEEVEFVSLEDLPEVNPFGPNGTPPRTPSPESFTEIHGASGSRNSNEILINEQRENESTVIGADTAITTNFVTPPSRPPQPPAAPRKKNLDRKSLKTIDSPSFFPETTARIGIRKSSHTLRLVSPRKHGLFPVLTDTKCVSSMILRSALKPRRSTRIKRMPNRYKYTFHRTDLRKKKERNFFKHFARKR
ncbi:hypothetical protein QQG55_31385 [Brugia pahangi]|uniref:C2H2-type domain-containing protein n=1 Tax=Brugia pahangi TaxID=6280 RepID=A0A0N4T125_BRUPA|nr:unnamed protein product [Brugia pahangi]